MASDSMESNVAIRWSYICSYNSLEWGVEVAIRAKFDDSYENFTTITSVCDMAI